MRFLVSVNVVTDGVFGNIYSVSASVYDRELNSIVSEFKGKLPDNIITLDIIKKGLINRNIHAKRYESLHDLAGALISFLEQYKDNFAYLLYDLSFGVLQLFEIMNKDYSTYYWLNLQTKVISIESIELLMPKNDLTNKYITMKLSAITSHEISNINLMYYLSLEELMFSNSSELISIVDNLGCDNLMVELDCIS